MTTRLITCKTCQKEISPAAVTCPHCGAPNKKKLGCVAKAGLGLIGVLVLMVMFAGLDEGGSGSSASAMAKTHRLNEAVTVGDLEWKITGARVSAGFSSDGLSVSAGSDESTMVLVTGTVTNRSNREVTHIGDLYLIDGQGRRYGEHDESLLVAKPLALDSFNPNVPKRFSTLFEVPRTATGLKFEATDFGLIRAQTALINLAGAPE
jgi:hypothetical protein